MDKKFINNAETVVEDLVSSMVLTYAPRLRKVDGYNILGGSVCLSVST